MGHEKETSSRQALLNRAVGTRVFLESPRQGAGRLLPVTLLGYHVGHSILVTPPVTGGREAAPWPPGEPLRLYFEVDGPVTLDTRLLQCCSEPYPYLHLAYPERLEATRLRRAERLQVRDLAIMLVLEEGGRKLSVALADISLSGARLVSSLRLGRVGERFSIEIPHHTGTAAEPVRLPCEVRYVRQETATDIEGAARTVFHHGVEFTGLDRKARAFLERYVDRHVMAQRRP